MHKLPSLLSCVLIASTLSFYCCTSSNAQSNYNRSVHGQAYPDYSQGGYNRSAHGQAYPDYSKSPYQPYYKQNHGGKYYTPPYGALGFGSTYGLSGFATPVPFGYGNGFYTMSSPTATYQFWKAPSGYYYPWYHYQGINPPYGYGVATSFVQGNIQPQQLELATIYQDLGKFLVQAKSEGKLQEGDYNQLNRRLNDLISKTNSTRFNQGGTLSEGSEEDLRTDFNNLSKEVSVRLK